jgi:hypothetical protein
MRRSNFTTPCVTSVALVVLASSTHPVDAGTIQLSITDTTPWNLINPGDTIRVRADVEMTDYPSTPMTGFDAVLSSDGEALMTYVGGTPDGDSPAYVPGNDAYRDTPGGPYVVESESNYDLNRARGFGELSQKTVHPSIHPLNYGPLGQYLDGNDGLWEWDITLSADIPLSQFVMDLLSANVYAFSITSAPLDGTVVSGATFQVRPVGDLNDDGFVGLDDLDVILNHWNQSIAPGGPLADPSGDGFAGLDDLDIVLNNWNAGTPPASTDVPEPVTGVLLVLSAPVWLLKRRG